MVNEWSLDVHHTTVFRSCALSMDQNWTSAAATEGVKRSDVTAYLDSLLQFAIEMKDEGSAYLEKLSAAIGNYQTTEAEVFEQFAPATAELSRDQGLTLVRAACDKLEAQVESLTHQPQLDVLKAV